ncbi:MAG: T9SS type A sorting domain-containing protein [Bacteroidales bacterium]|nr:T9SS type A sorting domain-containing protein [Bacteroidales bacterium]MCF8456940.1 T9SS type A sorting domain-containing protein [Bacteroidales bacterium]
MKKLVFILMLIGLSIGINPNPIIVPPGAISEIYFDSLGKWNVEIGFNNPNLNPYSVQIGSSHGSSYLDSIEIIESYNGINYFGYLAVIRQDDYMFEIDKNNDYVWLMSYDDYFYDYVEFGDYPGSMIDASKSTESIVNVGVVDSYFCKTNHPNIGEGNSIEGTQGWLNAKVYNKAGAMVTNGYLSIYHVCAAAIMSDGSFSGNIFARNYRADTINLSNSTDTNGRYLIESLLFTIDPEDTTTVEINLLQFLASSEILVKDDPVIAAFPNPFSDQIDFYISLPNQSWKGTFLDIFDLKGSIVSSKLLNSATQKVTWETDNSILSGVYVYRLTVNGRGVCTGKMIKQ